MREKMETFLIMYGQTAVTCVIVLIFILTCLSPFLFTPLGGTSEYRQVVSITELDSGESSVMFWGRYNAISIDNELIQQSGMRTPDVFCSIQTEQIGIFGEQNVVNAICTNNMK